jgi:tRNA (guanine10-N2)-dimethyltransferase
VYVLELAGEDDDFAAAEAGAAADGVSVVGPGIATADTLDSTRFERLAFAHRASDLLARTDATIDVAEDALRTADLAAPGPVAVRARDVRGTAGVDTQAAEGRLGQILVDAGYAVDLEAPASVLLALFAGETAYLGWMVAESVRDYGDRAPTDRPFFQPGSMDPRLARAVVNLAGVVPGDLVLDPMCGTGGLLIEAGLVGARPLGFDAQRRMVAGARENLDRYLSDAGTQAGDPLLGLANASSLPLRNGSVDAVVFDAPYGRQSKIAADSLSDLVGGALGEADRVGERGVLIADRSYESQAAEAGWQVRAVHERRVHRSLTRYVHVLE